MKSVVLGVPATPGVVVFVFVFAIVGDWLLLNTHCFCLVSLALVELFAVGRRRRAC